MILSPALLPLQLPTLVALGIDGVAFGLFLALVGVAITLVFGLGEVLNLAIGTFAVVGALVAITLAGNGVSVPLAALAGVLSVGVLGLVVDRTLLSLVYRSEGEERILLGIFTTLGLAIMIDGILFNYYPNRYSLGVNLPSVSLGKVAISPSSLLIIGVSAVVLAALFLFLTKTFLGQATRTVFQDEVGALLVGVEPRRVRSLVFIFSSLIAGLAGVLIATSASIQVTNGFDYTAFALIVSIVGGIRNVGGAILAGILLGLVIQYANFFIGSYQARLIMFAVVIVAILVNPEALS